jgi:hypothetical protein
MPPGRRRSRRSIALYLILATVAAGCDAEVGHEPVQSTACIEGGLFEAEIFGAIETRLEWRDADLECEGMPRPHGKGARLRFAGTGNADGENLDLAFIIALPDLEQGQSGRELPAGVTLMEESAGKFFSTPEPSTCWADITHHDLLQGDQADAGTRYRIGGSLYCVSPLAEVNGARNVTFTDVRFTGQLNWQVPQ